MTIDTPIKTWQFNTNNDHNHDADGEINIRQILLNIKNVMVNFDTFAWNVEYSCDASVAGTAGDGIDRWSDVSDVTHDTAGSAHSWIVLSQAGMEGIEACIDYAGGFFDVKNVTIVISFSAGFTGGTTTNRPTATDEHVILNQSTFFDGNGVLPGIVHGMMSDDGECTRIVIAEANVVDHYLTFEKLKDPIDNWSTPYIFGYSVSLEDYSRTFGTTSTDGFTAVFDGNIVYLEKLCTEFFLDSSAGETQVGTSVSSQNDFSGEFNLYPVGYYCNTPPYRGRHGELFDLFMIPDSLGSGEVIPSTGTSAWIAFGILLFPWDGSIGRLG